MRVCVLGHRGMLGHVVARYLGERGCTVTTIFSRFTKTDPVFLQELEAAEADWCINCIGLRASPAVPLDRLYQVNTLLPQYCAERLRGRARFVQASSDGVFRPDIANRIASEKGDATDSYGRSKCDAEEAVLRAGGIVLRCSILGPELGEPRSLLGWLLRQSGQVHGYTNHCWNGITTLEWAKVCWELMSRLGHTEDPVIQPGTWPPSSKCEVLRLIGEVWGLAVNVQPAVAQATVHRSLIPTWRRPSLERQLRDLRDWYDSDKLAGLAIR